MAATDGLWDNMWPEQLISVLQAKTLNKVRSNFSSFTRSRKHAMNGILAHTNVASNTLCSGHSGERCCAGT